jgi:hypothetical protein
MNCPRCGWHDYNGACRICGHNPLLQVIGCVVLIWFITFIAMGLIGLWTT